MKVSINRGSPIPLHDQLVTQVALLIASGVLPPGRRLPSVRDLAQRLDVHRNTVSAVYKTLESHGVVTVKPGSGVRVIDQAGPAPRDGAALGALAMRFVEDARAAGHDDEAIHQAVATALSPLRPRHIVVVDAHLDVAPIYMHELGQRFAFPMAVAAPEALREAELEDAALLTSLYHLTPLQAIVGAERRVIVFQVSAPEPLLSQLAAMPAGQTVGLVSVSDTILRMAKEVIAGVRGEALDVLEAHPDDAGALRAVARFADVLMADAPSHAAVKQATSKPVHRFQLIPEASLQSLAQQLPPEASLSADMPARSVP